MRRSKCAGISFIADKRKAIPSKSMGSVVIKVMKYETISGGERESKSLSVVMDFHGC
jgi:hypothetical protein